MGKRSGLWVMAIGGLTVINTDFRRCGLGPDDGYSAALYSSSTPTTVVGGTFSGNAARVGGSIYVDDAFFTTKMALHVSGTTFSGNKARDGLAGSRMVRASAAPARRGA